ncbi:MAG: hypothetical protein KBT13_01055, partial [Bacteroidales bacterium]|nr:hypothetical protein [Candidatus Sodaliphilus limicaballi]
MVTILLPLQGALIYLLSPKALPWASSNIALTARRHFVHFDTPSYSGIVLPDNELAIFIKESRISPLIQNGLIASIFHSNVPNQQISPTIRSQKLEQMHK